MHGLAWCLLRLRKNIVQITSGAEALIENTTIAALKALRHPKAGTFRQPLLSTMTSTSHNRQAMDCEALLTAHFSPSWRTSRYCEPIGGVSHCHPLTPIVRITRGSHQSAIR